MISDLEIPQKIRRDEELLDAEFQNLLKEYGSEGRQACNQNLFISFDLISIFHLFDSFFLADFSIFSKLHMLALHHV